MDLGRATIASLRGSDVTNLYVLEWPETKKMLIADHRAAIDQEPRRIKRWVRTESAMLFGLAKRLAPHRRVLFLLSFLAFFFCLFSLAQRMAKPPVTLFVEVGVTFLMMTVLLAMELIDKIKFRDELTLARDLQATLIPKQMPESETWEVAAYNRIANTVGGDIYDFNLLPDGRMAVLFGDASGHGMAAGLVMAVAHASYRTQLDADPSPPAVIASLNRILCRTGGSRSFFSCCYILLSPDGTYEATIAGHPPVLKIDGTGKVVERIGRGAYPLGVKAGLTWETVAGSLVPSERLLLHSDGLTESRNANDREFGDLYVETIAGWHPGDGAQSLVETIIGEWSLFVGNMAVEDDVSLAVLRRR